MLRKRSEKMKTLYIHIGTSKTGTTSLQHFCTENAALFQKQDYDYSIFPRKFKGINIMRNGHFLSYRAYNKDESRNLAEEEKLFREGMDFVLDKFKNANNVILSDEGIWSVVFKSDKPDLWEKIKREADKQGYQIKVIVYFRRQDGLADSWWNQKIKVGKRLYSTVSWEEYSKNPAKPELNYYGPLKYIEKYVGKENIIVRRFGKPYFKNGSLFEDFIDALGMEYDKNFIISEGQRNISLLGNAHEIKRIINDLPDLSDADNTFFRRITVSMSQQRPELKAETMFSSEEALDFMEKYREDNRKIMREYFNENADLFEMEFSNNKKWVLDHTEMEKDIVRFIGEVAIQLRKENKELRKNIKELGHELSKQDTIIRDLQKKIDNPLKTAIFSIKKKN